MRLTHSLMALAILPVLLLSPVVASGTVFFAVGSYSATYAADGMHVQFTFVDHLGIYDWLANTWPCDVGAVDVWRCKISDPLSAQTHVTALLWVNQPGVPYVTADFIDAGVEPNTTYEYFAYGLIGGQPRIEPPALIGCASTGVGLLCRGTLSNQPDCGVGGVFSAIPCDDACRGSLFLNSWTPSAGPYFNTPTTLAIYGEYDGLSYVLCNVIVPAFRITSVVEQSCVTAVEPATWGAVKAKYR
jgi:hypothetical protein